MSKIYTLLMFRHAEAFHNFEVSNRSNEMEYKTVNTSLTERGMMQASLLADRLKDTKFDIAITSDLPEAVETMDIVSQKNSSITQMLATKVLRERNFGEFEGISQLCSALLLVENAVNDRLTLTWAPPGGESVKELRDRVWTFLAELHKQATSSPAVSPVILVSSHGLFMEELLYVISNVKCAFKQFQQALQRMNGYQNTGLVQYTFTTKNSVMIDQDFVGINCPMISCAHHLKNHDRNYMFCYGGCHDVVSNEQPSKEIRPPQLIRIKRQSDLQ